MLDYSGRIVKGIGGFYYVDTADGVYECKARGIFRKQGITPLVGDIVEISADTGNKTGAIEKINKRHNSLLRPPVANVDTVAIVTATARPRPNLLLLDKLIAAVEYAKAEPLLCFNKTDIEDGADIAMIYEKAEFNVVCVSAETKENVDGLANFIKDKVTVFAGNSGVGKSSLLNIILGSSVFETGEVSNRVERGKHTTRHSELLPLPNGGYIIDTPGFGSFDTSLLLKPEDCVGLFREFDKYTDTCQFGDCSHTVEKGCGILEAVKNGEIAKSRHESYCRILEELRNSRGKNYYKKG